MFRKRKVRGVALNGCGESRIDVRFEVWSFWDGRERGLSFYKRTLQGFDVGEQETEERHSSSETRQRYHLDCLVPQPLPVRIEVKSERRAGSR